MTSFEDRLKEMEQEADSARKARERAKVEQEKNRRKFLAGFQETADVIMTVLDRSRLALQRYPMHISRTDDEIAMEVVVRVGEHRGLTGTLGRPDETETVRFRADPDALMVVSGSRRLTLAEVTEDQIEAILLDFFKPILDRE